MTRRLTGFALLGAALIFTTSSAFGFGGKRRSDCGTSAGYASPYASAYNSPCGAPGGSVTVSYVDQKVTVTEWKAVKEEYKYWENVSKTEKEKIKVKEQKTKEESYKYSVTEWQNAKEKVKVQ